MKTEMENMKIIDVEKLRSYLLDLGIAHYDIEHIMSGTKTITPVPKDSERFINSESGTLAEKLAKELGAMTDDEFDEEIRKVKNVIIPKEIEKLSEIACNCSEEDKHGETKIWCCNHCGKPIEDWWTNNESESDDDVLANLSYTDAQFKANLKLLLSKILEKQEEMLVASSFQRPAVSILDIQNCFKDFGVEIK